MTSITSLAKTAVLLLLALFTGQVDACIEADTMYSVCTGALGSDSSSTGFSFLCQTVAYLDDFFAPFGSIGSLLSKTDDDYTVFAPMNGAFEGVLGFLGATTPQEMAQKVGGAGKLEQIIFSHFLKAQEAPTDLLCKEKQNKVISTGKEYKPTITCVKAISGDKIAFLEGQGNKEYGKEVFRKDPRVTYPMIKNPADPLPFCNGLIYPLENGIALPKKFIKSITP